MVLCAGGTADAAGSYARQRQEKPVTSDRSSQRTGSAGESNRGKRATFDRKTGEVSGSGAGAGNPEGGAEDYADDLSTGSGGTSRVSDPGNGA